MWSIGFSYLATLHFRQQWYIFHGLDRVASIIQCLAWISISRKRNYCASTGLAEEETTSAKDVGMAERLRSVRSLIRYGKFERHTIKIHFDKIAWHNPCRAWPRGRHKDWRWSSIIYQCLSSSLTLYGGGVRETSHMISAAPWSKGIIGWVLCTIRQ